MKKFLVLCLCVLLIAAVAAPVSAAGTASLSRSDTSIYRGEKVTITVSVSDAASSRYGGIEVTVDSKFELVSGEWLVSGATMADFDVTQKDGVFTFDTAKKISGKIFKMTLKAKSDAAFGSGTVSVKLSLSGESADIVKSTTVTVECKHSYKYTNKNDTQHTRTCSICKESKDVNHTYDNPCDTSCNDCKAKRTISHSYATAWTSDTTGHWHACDLCGDKQDFAAHTSGGAATESQAETCTICSFEIAPALPHEHVYTDKYETDAAGHKLLCDSCQQPAELEEHTFDDDCDEVCDVCKFRRQVNHNVGAWEHNETSHWQTCADCGNQVNAGDHAWDAGVVTAAPTDKADGVKTYTCSGCGKTRTEKLPAIQTAPGNLAWWIWLIIGFGVGVLLTATVGVIVILPKTKKASKGKYSS